MQGMTVQLFVGSGSDGRLWYERLFQRPPDFRPQQDDTFLEWIFKSGHWEIHVVEHEPAGQQQARLRFSVADLDAERRRLGSDGIEMSAVEELPGVVRYCNFDDPWGNRLGMYQDASRWPG
jgi:hypothetical protein